MIFGELRLLAVGKASVDPPEEIVSQLLGIRLLEAYNINALGIDTAHDILTKRISSKHYISLLAFFEVIY